MSDGSQTYNAENLIVISPMNHDFKSAGNNVSDNHQILTTIHSLHDSWEALKLALTSNANIKPYDAISRHLELEVGMSWVNCNAVLVSHSAQCEPAWQKLGRYGEANVQYHGGKCTPLEAKNTVGPRISLSLVLQLQETWSLHLGMFQAEECISLP